jgi:hypothetical protein
MSYKMRSVFAVTILVLSAKAFAQDDSPAPPPPSPPKADAQQASPCPQMQIQSQARTVREGQPVMFTARITGGDKAVTPSILWNLSSGLIQDGQGTPRITVDSTGAGMYREIVAELWLGGYPPECPLQSNPFRVAVVPPAAKLMEFGEVSVDEENEKIVAAVNMALQTNDRLHVIGYAGRKSERAYIGTSLRRMREQIVKAGVQNNRVGVYDGGFREEPFFEFWIVPEGAEPPRPTPTIDRKEIVYPTAPRTTRTPARRP